MINIYKIRNKLEKLSYLSGTLYTIYSLYTKQSTL